LDGFDGVFGREFPHHQRQLTVGCRPNGIPINPLHVFRGAGTATIHFHNKFSIRHSLTLLLSFARNGLGITSGSFLYNRGTLAEVRDFPHSKQCAFDRDVINPQDGHILCDPNPAICGLSLRIP
jgi:hypothetical protein